MFFDTFDGLARVAIVSVCAYAFLVLVLRVAGKRSLAKLNAFDLVVTVAFGSTLATVLLSKDVAFAEGALAFAMLALLQYVVSKLSIRSGAFKRLLRSEPVLLVQDGRVLNDALAQERVTQGELEAALRKEGVRRFDELAAVVLETDGSLSVIRRGEGAVETLGSVRRIG